MVRAGNMASEKTQALYVPTDETPYEEKTPKKKENKYCTKFVLLWLLASFAIALLVGLIVELLFPVVQRHFHEDDIDTIHFNIFHKSDESSIEAQTKEPTKDKSVVPWHLDFLINPTRLCDPSQEQADPAVRLLVLVPSATAHFERRSAIRRTWGAVAAKPLGPVRLAFVLGTTPNSTEQSLVLAESSRFSDILQVDAEDTFRNLTAKSVLALRWVSEQCAHARYVLKTDDDTFVNLPVLLGRVLEKPEFEPSGKFVGGWVHEGGVPHRTPSEKYFVSEADYPELEYPPYASGAAYVTTGPVASQLYDASKRVTPVLPMEDVFVTGLCADEAGVRLMHEPSFQYSRGDSDCDWDGISSLATVHRMSPSDMGRVWQQMTSALRAAVDSPSFGGLSPADLFDFPAPESAFDDGDYYDQPRGDSLRDVQKDMGSIFDVFNRLKNQIENQLNDDLVQDSSQDAFSRLRDQIDGQLKEEFKDADTSQQESLEGPHQVQEGSSRVKIVLYAGDPGVEGPVALPAKVKINKGNLLSNPSVKGENETAILNSFLSL